MVCDIDIVVSQWTTRWCFLKLFAKKFNAIFLILIIAQATNNTVCAQTVDAHNIIIWKDDRPLSLKDFKIEKNNTPRLDSNITALTRTGITYYLSTGKYPGKVQITVIATVHKAHTYMKEKVLSFTTEGREWLLHHEQKHFDISEIFARRAARDLQTLKLTKNYRNEITQFVTKKFKEADAYQRLYDKETKNGEDIPAQEQWNAVIEKQLKELESYKNKVLLRNVGN